MDDEDGYFGERVAARYDETSAEMFKPGVVDAAADVLAGARRRRFQLRAVAARCLE